MLLAVGAQGEHVTALPGAVATCPNCNERVVPRCGQIVVWHWAHVAREDCDPWSEPESQWHLSWKRRFVDVGARVEVTMRRDGQHHRADVVLPQGVIELQRSSISVGEAHEREQFYGNMLWLFDMTDTDRWERVHFGRRGFWWKHGARSHAELRRTMWWDTPDGTMMRVRLRAVETPRGVRVLGRVLERVELGEFVDRFFLDPADAEEVSVCQGGPWDRWTYFTHELEQRRRAAERMGHSFVYARTNRLVERKDTEVERTERVWRYTA